MTLAEIIMDEQAARRRKVGLVPFISDGRCLFADGPIIAIGDVAGGEDEKAAAIKTGMDQLGLREDNMAINPWLGWSGTMTGDNRAYDLDVYAVLVKEETGQGSWLTRSEFTTKGRKAQAEIMDKIFDKIEVYLDS